MPKKLSKLAVQIVCIYQTVTDSFERKTKTLTLCGNDWPVCIINVEVNEAVTWYSGMHLRRVQAPVNEYKEISLAVNNTGPISYRVTITCATRINCNCMASCIDQTLGFIVTLMKWRRDLESRAARTDRRSLRSCWFLDFFPIISDPRFFSVRSGIGRFFYFICTIHEKNK